MSLLDLARTQFAMTTIFHFFFVPLSIGLGLVVAVMETLYVVKKDDLYKRMAKFWGHIFLLSFAVGVVTGIIQEFQFGMNWSAYSRFVGDIFGAPLAIEALLAFFLESTFLGLWIFGWEKFNKKMHLLFIWLVTIGSALSALWILLANSFMQHPAGYTLNSKTGRAELIDFGATFKNHQLWLEFPHVLFGAFLTGSFVVAGLSAWKVLKKKDLPFFTKSLKIGIIMGLISAVLTVAVGDLQTQALIEDQPMKFAATEGIYEDTEDPASWAGIAGFDQDKNKTTWSLEIPYMLSILGNHSLEGGFKGMNTINKELHAKYDSTQGTEMDYYVPTTALFWSFRFMAGCGTAVILLAILVLFFMRRGTLGKQKWLLWLTAISTTFPFISNTGGWLITELGRFPWTVYGLFTVADSVSPNVTKGQLWFSNSVFFLLFATLGGVMVYLVRNEMKKGPYHEEENEAQNATLDPFAKEAF